MGFWEEHSKFAPLLFPTRLLFHILIRNTTIMNFSNLNQFSNFNANKIADKKVIDNISRLSILKENLSIFYMLWYQSINDVKWIGSLKDYVEDLVSLCKFGKTFHPDQTFSLITSPLREKQNIKLMLAHVGPEWDRCLL